MSEPETTAKNFLLRWSQRKHAANRHADRAATPDQDLLPETDDPVRVESEGESASPAFDPETLPPIESITAVSDVRAFLMPGVPEELTRAALRRVWVSDPAIRDFVGIAENQWDFSRADGAPGFGPLKLTAELRRMIADLVGDTTGRGRQDGPAPAEEQAPGMAGYSVSPMGCTETDEQQRASSAGPGRLPSQSATPDGVSIPPSNADRAAAQQNRRRDTQDDAVSSDRRPGRHGSAVPK